ncbi:MAG: J domain-containing protein [Acidimicrobiaceae bacterium]|nr:J domain-containing protein [Acidimicrobiaceae bacterium]
MPVLIAVLLLIVAIVLLVLGVIATMVVWSSGSVLYMIISGVRHVRLSRELDTNSGIAPFMSLSLVNYEVHLVANDAYLQMRVAQEHRLSRNLALAGCAAILLILLVTAGVGSFIIGTVIGLPVAILIMSLLRRLPVQRRLIERKARRILLSIIESLESPSLAELQQITIRNADLSYRPDANPSDGLQNVVNYFNQNTSMVLDDPSLLEEKIVAELARSRQDNRRREQQSWQGHKEDRRRSAHGGFGADNEPTPYEVLGVRADLPIEEIRRVYLELVKLYHPDKGIAPDGERLKKINVAWDRIREGR